ncbi:AIPR family protein [Streptomyces sp. NPDC091377]|uniref:AIPR family protein n=1 Tax=Streptomyces sp. NPDC091377 TaxID=3365995 RepID=UPI00380569E1
MTGASIVNGAQTVRAVARAMHDDGEAAANATLSIKVINTHEDRKFGVQVSQAANRQNAIEQRDHIALEPVHQANQGQPARRPRSRLPSPRRGADRPRRQLHGEPLGAGPPGQPHPAVQT